MPLSRILNRSGRTSGYELVNGGKLENYNANNAYRNGIYITKIKNLPLWQN